MIRIVLMDIDGVLTDGKITFDSAGNEYKTMDFKDIDAVFQMKRKGMPIGLITGEWIPITLFFKDRLQPDYFFNGCKNKTEALEQILSETGLKAEDICYIGDGIHDIPILQMVGYPVCPANAIPEVKEVVKHVLITPGGEGCVWELMNWVFENNADKS